MTFKKGCVPWNKGGGEYSQKAKKNMRFGQKKRFEKKSAWNKGKSLSKETKKKLSEALKGRKAWNKGKKVPQWSGKKHWLWKGDEVGYRALHHWIVRNLGQPNFCEGCGTQERKKYQWANISGKYERNFEDWLRMCVPCHKSFDKKARKL